MTAAKLSSQLRSTFGEELRSVVLFGSVPRGEAVPGVSDLNILVLLDSFAAPQLARAAPVMQDWIRSGNTPPHLYSANEWSGMADTFAIEMTDMQDAREVLWGSDPVTTAAVTHNDLRLHTEREVRETILHLRLRLLLGANDPAEVGGLLVSGLPSFTAFLRATLRIGALEVSRDTRAVIERAAAVIEADPKPMLTCWQHRRTLRRLAIPITDPLVQQYVAFCHRLVNYLDRLPSTEPARPIVGSQVAEPVGAHH